MAKFVLCDACNKDSKGTIFGYDSCGDVSCDALLTIKANKERYSYPYSSHIPDKEDVVEAEKILNG